MRLSKSLCAVVGEVLASTGSHATLDELFRSAGAPGDPPALSHGSKWKSWVFRVGQDPNIDSFKVLGNLLEEFMDLPPEDLEALQQWQAKRAREARTRAGGFGRERPPLLSLRTGAPSGYAA